MIAGGTKGGLSHFPSEGSIFPEGNGEHNEDLIHYRPVSGDGNEQCSACQCIPDRSAGISND